MEHHGENIRKKKKTQSKKSTKLHPSIPDFVFFGQRTDELSQ